VISGIGTTASGGKQLNFLSHTDREVFKSSKKSVLSHNASETINPIKSQRHDHRIGGTHQRQDLVVKSRKVHACAVRVRCGEHLSQANRRGRMLDLVPNQFVNKVPGALMKSDG
jgi:hypothetical protein